jgi:hypothetical protein
MANAAVVLYRIYELPWSTGFDDDRRFKQLARNSLVAAVVFALLFWILPQPKIDPRDVPEVPKTLVRLVLEQKQQPPPPPVVREEPKPVDLAQQARDRAKVAGLLPLTNALQSLRDNLASAVKRPERSQASIRPT